MDIKQTSIREYLRRMGITPKRERPSYGMYLSPLRNESNPSFKVDYGKNLWYDHGTGVGGSIIDLVMRMRQCGFIEAVRELENQPSALPVQN